MKHFLWALFFGMIAGLSACQNPPQASTPATSEVVAHPVVTASPALVQVSATLPLSATETANPPPLPTATHTPPPTVTPQPSPTPRGALSWEQEERLYAASLKFLAEDEDTATYIVQNEIDYLESNGEHPSLVCGPLSAVILRDAGLLPPDTDLHGFWLLDPRQRGAQIVLETYFPRERYAWYRFDTPTTEFDFDAFPLLPGDFLYLYAGPNGTFEHIITVNRVDEAGRAYTVSNLATEAGFVIRELMLYDPGAPGVGQFYDWMNRDLNQWLGMTGDGGFDLWRPLPPVKDYGDAGQP